MTDTEIPRWPVITAKVSPNGDGHITATVTLPDGTAKTASSGVLADTREQVLDLVAAYAREKVGHAVRLEVTDPDGSWLIGVHLDGTRVALNGTPTAPRDVEAADEKPRQEIRVVDGGREGGASVALATPPPAIAGDNGGSGLDRGRLHPLRRGPAMQMLLRWREQLKDPEERREDEADEHLARRYTLTDTNYIVVTTNKGGPGKTTLSLALGDALASRLPNQRVLAVDLNAGGGALGAAATEDRQARFSLLQLHHDRAKIDRHSKLEPYVASLASGLDLLSVPPDPRNALAITPQHYQELFDQLLAPNYNLILLDTSPDITSNVTQWALRRGTQMIIVVEQGYLSGEVVMHSLGYLLEQPAAGHDGSQATIVVNKVLDDPRAGSIDETERAMRKVHSGPIIRIPWDLNLRAQIDTGRYTLDHVRRRSTRLPIKQLALEVTDRFI